MPVITVSRMFGSGGSVIAAEVARALGWTLVDNAFVEGVAGRLGTTPAAVEAIEERVPTLAERLADAFALGSSEVVSASLGSPMPPSEQRVLEMTRRMIDDTLSRGPAVLVGRGAQAYLESRVDALHVLCSAPMDALVARVVDRERITPVEAAALIREKNHQRAQFVRRNWGRDWLSPEHYHLCLNTEWLGIELSVELVLRVAAARFHAVGGDS
jgi:cytidylate kinase